MKTQEEILERYNERKDGDSLGFEVDKYPEWLTFENVKKLGILKEDVTEEEWNKYYKEPTYENIMAKMKDYISFAYEKARDQKSISAWRSLAHYQAWIWLLDDGFSDEFNKEVEDNYDNYGISILDILNEKYQLLKEQS